MNRIFKLGFYVMSFGTLLWSVFYISSVWVKVNRSLPEFIGNVEISGEADPSEIIIDKVLFRNGNRHHSKPKDRIAKELFFVIEVERVRGLEYHVKRIIITRVLDAKFTDTEMLKLYLSKVYLGNGEYGVATVSKSIFQKDISDLTPEEVVAIAALVEYPAARSNKGRWDELKVRLIERCAENC